jgi:hypothetical protein
METSSIISIAAVAATVANVPAASDGRTSTISLTMRKDGMPRAEPMGPPITVSLRAWT